jgi:uncharacterized protein YacL
VLPGEGLSVRIVKVGEEPGQGIGYLEDGTMVVVEGCAKRMNEVVAITVTSVIQRSAGRMIFGRPGEPSASLPATKPIDDKPPAASPPRS